ncbi:MAG: hypothetical protein ACYTG6_02920 [Planctomycetota bacterium]
MRTIAILMLLAGISVGIFASRGLRALGPAEDAPSASAQVPPRIEQKVDLYQRAFQLDDRRADLIRRELLRYDSEIRAKILELRQKHAPEFDLLFQETEARIDEILKEQD